MTTLFDSRVRFELIEDDEVVESEILGTSIKASHRARMASANGQSWQIVDIHTGRIISRGGSQVPMFEVVDPFEVELDEDGNGRILR